VKNSFVVMQEHKEIFDSLTDEQAGLLIKAIFQYEEDKSEPEFDGVLKFAFIPIRQSLDKCPWIWRPMRITSESQKIRNSMEYRDWRKKVFERDNYTCRHCGQVSGQLNAHHIKSFSKHKLLRFDVDNGITLCKTCHNYLHSKAVKT
jgi:hypothetical protein